MATDFRTVVDTNVVISAQSGNPSSPSFEIFMRWKNGQLAFLYSVDTLTEYITKLIELGISRKMITETLTTIREYEEVVSIIRYHERNYPTDPDDVAFLLCATNGDATHLVSYDRHLLALDHRYDFEICRPIPFLKQLREQ